MMDLNILINS